MDEHRDFSLILLVGSNPLPNYIAACALRPSRLVLVYTEETKPAKERLESNLRPVLGEVCYIDSSVVNDATCATTVWREISSLLVSSPNEVWLNYTGGTKVMATHAHAAFLRSGGTLENASYLDEGGKDRPPRLRFDSGAEEPLAEYPDIPLDLKILLSLHDIRPNPRQPKYPAPTRDDAREILCKVLQDVPLADRLYRESQRLIEYNNPRNAVSNPFRTEHFGLTLSLAVFPLDDQLAALGNRKACESWFKQWYKFIGGEWLEDWVGEQIQSLALKPEPEIVVGVNACRVTQKAKLEIDVAVVRGHRSYFISCTTDTTKKLCKSKLFEVAVRSRQLGGDLARAALVCLAEDSVVSELQAEIEDVWGASNATEVFGLSDIRSWSDCGDKPSNRYSLKKWLES